MALAGCGTVTTPEAPRRFAAVKRAQVSATRCEAVQPLRIRKVSKRARKKWQYWQLTLAGQAFDPVRLTRSNTSQAALDASTFALLKLFLIRKAAFACNPNLIVDYLPLTIRRPHSSSPRHLRLRRPFRCSWHEQTPSMPADTGWRRC